MSTHKVISSKDISKTVKNGGKIKRAKSGPVSVPQDQSSLINKLNQVVETNKASAKHNKEQLDSISNRLVGALSHKSMDSAVIAEIIDAIAGMNEYKMDLISKYISKSIDHQSMGSSGVSEIIETITKVNQEKMDLISKHVADSPSCDSINSSAVAEIIEAITRIKDTPRPNYEFDIQRDGRNLMTRVIVTTKHPSPKLLN